MGDLCAGLGGGDGGAACVGKEIEYFHLSARGDGFADDLREPIPVDSLLGKEPGVFEVKGLEAEGEVAIVDGPLLGKVYEFPLAAAFFAAVVVRVWLFPLFAAGRFPYNLRIRTDQLIAAP